MGFFDWLMIALVAWAIGAFYWYFLKPCPQCSQRFYRQYLGEEEIDRWVGTKKVEVSIKTKDRKFNNMVETGKRTEHVSTTYVKIRRFYCCKYCGYEWNKVVKKEMK